MQRDERGERPRGVRARAVRPRTISQRMISRRDLERGRVLYPDRGEPRPRTRGDCAGGIRPCPYVACKWNLYLDVGRSGSIKLNFPDLEPEQLGETCALDVADRGGLPLEQVGDLMNMTRERVRQIEEMALMRLKEMRELAAHVEDEERRPVRAHTESEEE